MESKFSTQNKHDLEHRNWLKAVLALYHIKTGLHSFTEGVSLMHNHPVQKIYHGPALAQPKCRQHKISSKSDFNDMPFEESDDDEDKLCAGVYHDELPYLFEKSVIMAEKLKRQFDVLNDSSDRTCVACYKKKRIESASSLQRGQHTFISHQHQKTYLCQQSSPYQHHAIITEVCLISVCNDFIKDYKRKEIKLNKENSILDLIYNTICVGKYFYSNSLNVILQTVDSIVRKSVECDFVKWYGLIINNCEHFATWCLVGKDDKFQAQSLIPNLTLPREDNQASISLPWKDSVLRESVEWNFSKRPDNHWPQNFLSEDCIESDLWDLWIDSKLDYLSLCFATVLNKKQSGRDNVTDKEQAMIPLHGEKTLKSHDRVHVAAENISTDIIYHCSPYRFSGQAHSSIACHQKESPSALVQWTNTLDMFLQLNADKLKQDTGKNSPLTMWDLAGQYLFFSTYQIFLTRCAIYLMVSDVTGKVTNLVDDEYYFDNEREMKCKVNDSEQDYPLQCLVRVLNEHKSMRDSVANIIPPHGKITLKSLEGADVIVEDQDTKVLYCYSPQQDFGQALSPTSFQQEESPSVLFMLMNSLTMIKLLADNSAKLKEIGRNLPLTVWDFADLYVFYTTHQMFLIRLDIHLLLSDASELFTDHVADPCYFNSGEIMNCKVYAKILEGAECRFEVVECKNTDEIYLRPYAKVIHNRRILQSCINAIIACTESLPSQSAERVLYLMYPYMENGDLPGNINFENSAKNMCIKGQEFNFQTRTRCALQIVCAVGYLHSSSVRAPVFHQTATSNSVFLAGYFGMKIGDFGIAVQAIQNINVANWTTIQGRNDYNLCNMSLDKYNASKIFSVGVYSDTTCYLQTIRGQEWLRRAMNGTENIPWLSTFAPKCCRQSVSFSWKKLYQIWLDCNVCMEDRTDERIKTREKYLHHIFEMCTALLSSNRRQDQHELSHTLQVIEDIIKLACNGEMDSFSEENVAFIMASVMKMQASSSLPTDDAGVQQGGGDEDLSGSISWDSIVSLRTPDKHSQKCRKQNTVYEIQMVDSLHMSLKDFFERKFNTFDLMEDGNETEHQIQFDIMQHEQSITNIDEQNVKDIGLKDRKKSDFHSTIWLTRNPLPPPNLSQDVIVQFFEGQTTYELREILTQLASDNIPETQTMMKFEMLRLCTMKHFPRGNRPFAIRIIGAGFYYGGCNDQVICYCCGSRKDNWVLEDIPLLIHQKLAPRCSFLTNNAVVNIPIRKANSPQSTTDARLLAIQRTDGSVTSDTTQGVSSLMLPSSEQNHIKISNEMREMLVTNKGSPPNHLVSSVGQNVIDNQHASIAIINSVKEPPPKYPQYAVKNTRINSFHGWPAELHQRPEEMAECGFYFAGFSDCVRCFHCGVGLRHWMSEDDPWIEHARWSISCFYVYKMKGEEFVSLVKMAVEIAEREEAKKNNNGPNQPPTNNTNTDTAKKDSQNNTANDSAVPGESTSSTITTCVAAGGATASTPSFGDADIKKYLLTDAAQSVLDMGYQPKLVQRAIEKILMKMGPNEMTGQIIMEAVFEIEEEGSAKSKSKPSSQSAQENERNEKANANHEENNKEDNKQVYGAAEDASGEEVQIDPEKIRREHKELHETTLCKICLDNTISVVFLPCGHLVTCPDCAPAMRKCPICRTLIKGTVKIFFG